MDRRHTWAIMESVVPQFISGGVHSPLELDAMDPDAVEITISSTGDRRAGRDSWRSYRLGAAKASSADALLIDQQNIEVRSFRRAVKRRRAEMTLSAPSSAVGLSATRLPANNDRMGPAARIKAIRTSGQTPLRVGRFILDRTQVNLLKQVRGSLPAIPSALNCFADFCELRAAQPFPATELIVMEWSASFSGTATFANYISRLQTVCFCVGSPATWLTPAGRHVSRGLKKCHDTAFRFPNFIRCQLLLRIAQQESDESDLGQACWLSFLFAFRVPSETLHLVIAYRGDEISFPPIARMP